MLLRGRGLALFCSAVSEHDRARCTPPAEIYWNDVTIYAPGLWEMPDPR
ncbi:MAG: hypothetical protein M3Y87_32810 [Myxococcota bacterium]|nr:hypothetical protein [Myxococcota bacterium]